MAISTASADSISTRALAQSDWPLIEILFGDEWRLRRLLVHVVAGADGRQDLGGSQRRAQSRRVQALVETGEASGILALAGQTRRDGALGPPGAFPRIERSRALDRAPGIRRRGH